MEPQTIDDLINALVNAHPNKPELLRQINHALKRAELSGDVTVSEELKVMAYLCSKRAS